MLRNSSIAVHFHLVRPRPVRGGASGAWPSPGFSALSRRNLRPPSARRPLCGSNLCVVYRRIVNVFLTFRAAAVKLLPSQGGDEDFDADQDQDDAAQDGGLA